MWTAEQIHKINKRQKAFFRTGKTLPVEFRIAQLKKLKRAVQKNEKRLTDALYADLGRSKTEAYFCDIGALIAEINETITGLRKWARPETHLSGLVAFPSVLTKVYPMPYGTVLIISPFNFPYLLSLGVLTAAIAGGNTAMIKASSKSAHCTEVLRALISETFPEQYITVIDGGHDVADLCLAERFDKIFYTGSPKVGKHVMEMAAKHLTPVALELGGENGNWCIVRADANIRDAARKIVFFKLLNAGQICININQVAVAEEVADEFLREVRAELLRQIGDDALKHPEYPKLISHAAYEKCMDTARQYQERIVLGGKGNPATDQVQPTVIYPVRPDEPVVMREHFSPLLPVVPYKDQEIDKLLDTISRREHGLALYVFTQDKAWAERTMKRLQYGGGCVNEVCLHIMVKGVPFGGTGHSGMGAYHGKWGFREFTHPKTVLYGSDRFNLPLREHPFSDKAAWKEVLIRLFER